MKLERASSHECLLTSYFQLRTIYSDSKCRLRNRDDRVATNPGHDFAGLTAVISRPVSRGSDSPCVYRIVRGIRLILRGNFVENFMPLPSLSLSLSLSRCVCMCVSLDTETDRRKYLRRLLASDRM